MGGQATKEFGTQRIDKKSFLRVLELLSEALYGNTDWRGSDGTPISYIRWIDEKQTFGDCDLLSTYQHVKFEEALKQYDKIKIIGVKNNGTVCSYAMRFMISKDKWSEAFQVDHIKVSPKDFDFALNYYAYNDLGNLIGRIASAFGLKFGHDGLFIKAWFKADGESSNVVSLKSEYDEDKAENGTATFKLERLITQDFDKALAILGFNPERYKEGFADFNELFEYVAGSAFFNKDYYSLENRNHDQRVRDRKRPTYRAALQFFDMCPYADKAATREAFKINLRKECPGIVRIKRDMRKTVKTKYFLSRRLSAKRIKGLLRSRFNYLVGVESCDEKYRVMEFKRFGSTMQHIKANYDRNLIVNANNEIWCDHLTKLLREVVL